MTRIYTILLTTILLTGQSFAQGNTLLNAYRMHHLEAALDARDMTLDDLQFERDVASPNRFSPLSKKMLQDPLAITTLADETVAALISTNSQPLWNLLYRLSDLSVPSPTHTGLLIQETPDSLSMLSDELKTALNTFIATHLNVEKTLNQAFALITPRQKTYASAALLTETLDLKNKPLLRAQIVSNGIPDAIIAQIIDENEALDPRASASNQLNIVYGIDYAALLKASQQYEQAVEGLIHNLQQVTNWPDSVIAATTPIGIIEIGTTRSDEYSGNAALVIDPGGDDLYHDTSIANGLNGHPLTALIDLNGHDYYTGTNPLGAGTALWGISVCHDLNGDDVYRSPATGQGAGLFGTVLFVDHAGDDHYIAGTFAQAAAYGGVGLLEDHGGNDMFTIQAVGQAYAGVCGTALLINRNGNDVYTAGRMLQDYERHWQNYASLAQGFATGMRPFSGGGTAILFDQSGNDTYMADVYGQGVSYWYSTAMLLDLDGHDTYRIHEYGQGTGIHLSTALLADYNGNDFYTGYSLAQGAAHDYAVGMLFDLQGNDTYTSDHHSQGRAINNALAILLDDRGDDAYFARNPDSAQGAGNFTPLREYGSLAMLIDLANTDTYSCGATNGSRMLRPYYGIVYDLATNQPLPDLVPHDNLPPAVYTNLTPDELMYHASRYGDTPQKRVNKDAAVEELKKRAPGILYYLMEHLDTDNMWYSIYLDNIVRELPPETNAPVLIDILQNAPDKKTAKFAIFMLGYHNTPEYIPQIMHGLTNEYTAGATIRTLGKWQAANAVEQIIPFLSHTNERKRIIAVNALHDIGSTNARPFLLPLTNDAFFTVRESAKRAIDALQE